jgi:drug/metabolite transporter (DMT)-like permease
MVLGLITAFATAICYGVASVLQALAARRTEVGGAVDPRVLVRMVKQLPYLIGLGLDGLGFCVSLVAMALLPLFLVEAVIASSIGITAVLAVRFLGIVLSQLEKSAVVALIIGLALLALSASPEDPQPLTDSGKVVLGVGFLLVLAFAGVTAKFGGQQLGILLAVGAGLGFSGLGVAARTLVIPDDWWRVVFEINFYAIILYGLLGMLLFTTALQRARVTSVMAVTFGLETILPAAIGVAFLGDHARSGLVWAAVLGFVLAVISVLVLARAQPEE